MIDTWKNWQSILNYAHIIVGKRPAEHKKNISNELKVWRDTNKINDIKILKMTQSGHIFYINTPIVEISSSMIRKYFSERKTIDEYLPSNIISYIKKNNLYMDN